MAYTKQTWDTTSYVNPTRMNYMEDGIKNCDDNMDKVKQGAIGSDANQYRVLVSRNASDTTETDTVRKCTGLTYQANTGHLRLVRPHTSTSAVSENFTIGNNIPVGTEGNVYGAMRLFGQGEYYAQFTDVNNSLTNNRTYELPNKNGVLALTSDIASTRYLKKSETSGNKFYLQGKTNTWFKVCFAYSQYNILFTSGFTYNTVAKIGGETVEVTVNTETGVVAFSGNNSSIRNNTNVLVEEIPI